MPCTAIYTYFQMVCRNYVRILCQGGDHSKKVLFGRIFTTISAKLCGKMCLTCRSSFIQRMGGECQQFPNNFLYFRIPSFPQYPKILSISDHHLIILSHHFPRIPRAGRGAPHLGQCQPGLQQLGDGRGSRARGAEDRTGGEVENFFTGLSHLWPGL